MRSLIVMRHAKTENQSDSGRDFDRCLTDLGVAQARAIGSHILDKAWVPDVVLVSSAQRTMQTAEAVAEAMRLDADRLKLNSDAYASSPGMLWQLLQKLDGDRRMVIAHNPGVEQLVYQLTGDMVPMSPGTAVLLTIAEEQGKLVDVLRP